MCSQVIQIVTRICQKPSNHSKKYLCSAPMASLLDSVTVTRVFSLPIAASVSSSSAAPSVSRRRISPARFLEFRGLKSSRSLVTQSASLGANRRTRIARGGRIACEAQDTTAAAVEGNFSFLIVQLVDLNLKSVRIQLHHLYNYLDC